MVVREQYLAHDDLPRLAELERDVTPAFAMKEAEELDPMKAVELLGLQPARKDLMTPMYWLLAPLAVFLLGYLLFALLRAERF